MKKRVKNKLEQNNPAQGDEKPKRTGGPGLTTPDLVILSLLAERPMHGYEVNATLEDRNIRDWAGVSRPQIYYSLEKLAWMGLIRVTEKGQPSAGPERRVLETTASGRKHLREALDKNHWSTSRGLQPFLTWLALSWQAAPETFVRQVNQRHSFLRKQLAEEQATLKDVLAEVGHPYHEAVWMLKLVIAQVELELKWLDQLGHEAPKRAPAKLPPASSS